MSITVIEKIESREFTKTQEKDTLKRVYLVYGTDDEHEVAAMLPPINSQYLDKKLYVSSVNVAWAKGGNNDCWYCEVNYEGDRAGGGKINRPNTGSWQLDLSAKTEKITNTKKLADQTHWPVDADVGTVIGLNDDKVDGVDIYVPAGSLTITAVRKHSDITPAYIQNLIMIEGSVNSADYDGNWGTFAAGSLLFTGASLSRNNAESVQTQYNFLISTNVTGLQVETNLMYSDGSIITTTNSIDKKGWQYLWYAYRDFPVLKSGETYDPNSTPKKRLVSSVHLATVYPEYDFNDYINLEGIRWLNDVED